MFYFICTLVLFVCLIVYFVANKQVIQSLNQRLKAVEKVLKIEEDY